MRVWDIPVEKLCRKHLLGQHVEIHVLYKTLQTGRPAWSNHPETKRWRNKQAALKAVHDATAAEMVRRGYKHNSPLPEPEQGVAHQEELIQTVEEQIKKLKEKGCDCNV